MQVWAFQPSLWLIGGGFGRPRPRSRHPDGTGGAVEAGKVVRSDLGFGGDPWIKSGVGGNRATKFPPAIRPGNGAPLTLPHLHRVSFL